MPYPRAGCQTCRTRRIKCDEAKPTCQRCIGSRRICFYETASAESGVVLHSENAYASGQKKRPRGPRSVLQARDSATVSTVVHRPLIDLKTRALLYYTHDHLQTLKGAPDVVRGVSDHVLPVWRSKAGYEMLDLAVSSMALMTFARTQQVPAAAVEASSNYNQLLKTARVRIGSLGNEDVDTCLLAIFFMSRYENMVYRPNPGLSPSEIASDMRSFSHDDGALAILKFWKTRLSHEHPPTSVIKQIRRGALRSALLRNLSLPSWILDGKDFGERGPELDFDRIMVQISLIRSHVLALMNGGRRSLHEARDATMEIEDLRAQGREIEQKMQAWAANFPTSWRYERHALSEPYPWPLPDFYSPVVYSYTNASFAGVWALYDAIRMLVNSTRLKILDLASSPDPLCDEDDSVDRERFECAATLRTLADDLASSVPFCLQRFRIINDTGARGSKSGSKSVVLQNWEEVKPFMGTLMIWPLTIAACLTNLDAGQRLWFRSELARLGRITGTGICEACDSGPWLEL